MARMNGSSSHLDPHQFPHHFAAVVSRRTLQALRQVLEPGALDDDGPTLGPGWFDSSWELGRGLEVREGLPADAGLNEWLAVCLRS